MEDREGPNELSIVNKEFIPVVLGASGLPKGPRKFQLVSDILTYVHICPIISLGRPPALLSPGHPERTPSQTIPCPKPHHPSKIMGRGFLFRPPQERLRPYPRIKWFKIRR